MDGKAFNDNRKVDIDHFEHQNINFELNNMGIGKFNYR